MQMKQDEKEHSGNVSNVLDHIQKLPSLPSVVIEILQNFDNERVDVTTLAKKIACDQAIVARVLRVANSPFFGLSGQVGSIFEAVSILGFNNLRGLVTAAAIINAFPNSEKGFDWSEFWCHGISTAVSAKVLAKRVGLNPETAFTAGLLHDIGKLVMGVYFPQVFMQVHEFEDGGSIEALQAERALLGMDHAVLGGEVAKRWNFPPGIQVAVELHHTEARVGAEMTLADVVYIANLFAHALENGHIRESRAVHLALQARARLGIEADKMDALAEEVQSMYDGAVKLMGG
jgi:putative nucleotidyltransferase with HDIG domain